jgi:hypothetical protein
MVSDGQMEPVGLEGVVLAAEHGANVRRVLARGIKVRVVPDLRWQVHRHLLAPDHAACLQVGARLQRGVAAALEQAGEAGADGAPLDAGPAHECVERRLVKHRLELALVEEALKDELAHVDHGVANGDADAWIARARGVGEDSKGQILDRKLATVRTGHPRCHAARECGSLRARRSSAPPKVVVQR